MGNFLKKLLIEISLFILMAALTGHVAVSFWERYFVQDKLADIKNSLNHLKLTVHNMGYAYDELEQDLRDLARINSKSNSFNPLRETSKDSCKRRRELDGKILNQLTRVNDKPRHVLIVDKNTGSPPTDFARRIVQPKNKADRMNGCLMDITAPVLPILWRLLQVAGVPNVYCDILYAEVAGYTGARQKSLRTTTTVFRGQRVSAKALTKNATTITRYPLKATAIGLEAVNPSCFKASRDDNECIYNCILRNSARKCYEDCKSRNRFQKF